MRQVTTENSSPTSSQQVKKQEAFFKACAEGQIDTVETLLKDPNVNVNQPDTYGSTPLYLACQNGHTEVVRFLLNAGADVNKPDNDGKSPLWIACRYGHTEAVQLLLNQPNISVNQPNKYGSPPLWVACRYGHTEVVQLLLKSPGIDVNQHDSYEGDSPFYVACRYGHTEVVQLLLNSPGIDVYQPDNCGNSPLQIACQNGHTEVVRLLLKSPGIDVNQHDNYGNSPLWAACSRGHTEVVRLLLNAGADLDQAENSRFNANRLSTDLLNTRECTLVFYATNEDKKAAKLLELNKIAYLLCTLPKDKPIGRNWDMNNETLAAMVQAGHLYYEAKAESIQKKIIMIYSGVFKNDEGEDKRVTVFTSEKPKEVLYAVLPSELWEIVFMHMMDDAALPTVNETPLRIRNFLEALDKIDREKDAEATQTSAVAHETDAQAGAEVTTVAALLANSSVTTTATPIARDATAEEEMAAADNATAGPSSS